ncbi:MAG: DEAD/DEAH box helicase, partial [Thermoguttaceae bacterium]|nr:DEAD/DEAH box helicase [Thermoguttaceae bacterium]
MLATLAEVHYDKPTPIQAGTIPMILAGKDLMGQSRTGSGKTAAFMIPIIEKIDPRAAAGDGDSAAVPPGDDPVALIVVPTRELAVQ